MGVQTAVSLGAAGTTTVGMLSLYSGGLLLVVFIGVGVAISYYSLSPLEEWVSFSVWGTNEQNWSADKTITEFQKAAQGIEVDIDEDNDKKGKKSA